MTSDRIENEIIIEDVENRTEDEERDAELVLRNQISWRVHPEETIQLEISEKKELKQERESKIFWINLMLLSFIIILSIIQILLVISFYSGFKKYMESFMESMISTENISVIAKPALLNTTIESRDNIIKVKLNITSYNVTDGVISLKVANITIIGDGDVILKEIFIDKCIENITEIYINGKIPLSYDEYVLHINKTKKLLLTITCYKNKMLDKCKSNSYYCLFTINDYLFIINIVL